MPILNVSQGGVWYQIPIQSAAELLALIKSVDGANSGLDADLLDGQQGTFYTGLSSTNANDISDLQDDAIVQDIAIALNTAKRTYPLADETKVAGIETGATADMTPAELLAAIKTVDGSGSGLDAELLDGWFSTTNPSGNSVVVREASGKIRGADLEANGNITATGYLSVDGETTFGPLEGGDQVISVRPASGLLDFRTLTSTAIGSGPKIRFDAEFTDGTGGTDHGSGTLHQVAADSPNSSPVAKLKWTGDLETAGKLVTGGSVTTNGSVTVQSGNIWVSGTVDGRDVAADGTKLDGIDTGATDDQTAGEILALLLTVDGNGSGLDADKLDGFTGGDYFNLDNATSTLNKAQLRSDVKYYNIDPNFHADQNSHWGSYQSPSLAMIAGFPVYFENKSQFSRPVLEYSVDSGSNWLPAAFTDDEIGDMTKGRFDPSTVLTLLAVDAWTNFRMTWEPDDMNLSYVFLTDMVMYTSAKGNDNVWHLEKRNYDTGLYENIMTSGILDGWPNLERFQFDSVSLRNAYSGTFDRVRIVIDLPWNTANDVDIYTIDWWGTYQPNQQNAVFEWDRDRNMTTQANFTTTGDFLSKGDIDVWGAVDGRDVALDGTKLDGIETAATADQTAAEILAELITVDGASSGLDADLLDGQQGTFYTGLSSGNANDISDLQDAAIIQDAAIALNTAKNSYPNADSGKLAGIEAGATADQTANEILTAIKTVDGVGSGLDAALVDGYGQSAGTTADTIVRRTGAGHIAAVNINPTGTVDGRDVATDGTKLDGIETSADVTDAGNVAAAGAFMATNVIDEDTMLSNLDTKVPTQQSVKAYVDAAVVSSVQYRGSYDAATNTPDLDTAPSGLEQGDMYTVTVAGTFFTTALEVGDVLIAEITTPTVEADWTIVNKDLDANSILTSIKTVDGAGSGLDADLLDGQQGTFYTGLSSGNANDISDLQDAAIIQDAAIALNTAKNSYPNADSGKLAGIETGATADQTAGEIEAIVNHDNLLGFESAEHIRWDNNGLTQLHSSRYVASHLLDAIKTVDGTGSGLDADLLDGYNQTSGPTANTIARRMASGGIDVTSVDISGTEIIDSSGNVDGRDVAADGTKLDGIETAATADQTAAEILTAIKTVDGSGSGLDADLLDGFYSTTNPNSNSVAVRNAQGDLYAEEFDATTSVNSPRYDTLGSSMAEIENLVALPKGYVTDGLEFRMDTSQTGYIMDEDSGAVLTVTAGTDPGAALMANLFKYSNTYININTYKDGSNNFEFELTGIALSNSSNKNWRPYVVFHSAGNQVTTITVDGLEGDGTTWTQLWSGSGTSFVVPTAYAAFTTGILKGLRFSFDGIVASSYLKMVGATSTTSDSFAWSMLKGGGSFYGYVNGMDSGVEKWSITQSGQAYFAHSILTDGTVDGRDLQTDGTKLDGIATGAEVNPAPPSNPEITAGTETAERSMSPANIVSFISQHETDSSTVKGSSNDTTAGYLEDKLVAGEGVEVTTLTDGGDEDLEIALTAEYLALAASVLFTGAELSVSATPGSFDITAGMGMVIDASSYPTVTETPVTISADTIAVTTIANPVTYILVTSAGAIHQQAAFPTPSERRTKIFIGVVVHSDGATVNLVNNLPSVGIDALAQTHDTMHALGLMKLSGNIIFGNIAGNLKMDRSAGSMFKAGVNFHNDPTDPHTASQSSATNLTFRYRNQDSSEGSDITDIDPTTYDLAGVTTAIGGSNNQATIQRVYIFPSGAARVQRGQEIFSSISNAVDLLGKETFVVEDNISENGLLLGSWAIKKGATDLTNTSDAQFFIASRFGELGSGGSSITTTMQDAYDNSVIPHILTNATLYGLTIRIGSGSDNDDAFTVENTAGTTVFEIDGNGNVTPVGLVDGRDIATDGSAQDAHLALTDEHIDWTGAADDFETSGELRSGATFITGNLAVTGTVDGRDVAADGTAQDSHLALTNEHIDWTSATPDFLTTGRVETSEIRLTDPGVGNTSFVRFLKGSDVAEIRVTESVSDSTEFQFFMADNPSGYGDKFNWFMDSWQGAGRDWKPLEFSGYDATISALNVEFNGNLDVGNARYYAATGVQSTVSEDKTGTITVAPDISSATNTTLIPVYIVLDSNTTFSAYDRAGGSAYVTAVTITGGAQAITDGITVTFSSTSGGITGDKYWFGVWPEGSFNSTVGIDINSNAFVDASRNITATSLTTTGTVNSRNMTTDGSKLDGIDTGATDDQTAQEILDAIKTVDGSGSGLDADFLDGDTKANILALSNATGNLLPANMSSTAGHYDIDPAFHADENSYHGTITAPTLAEVAGFPVFFENKTQFVIPVAEYSTDGGTIWNTAPYTAAQLGDLVKGRYDGSGITIANADAWTNFRLTWDAADIKSGYVFLTDVAVFISGKGNDNIIHVEKKDFDTGLFENVMTSGDVDGWPEIARLQHSYIKSRNLSGYYPQSRLVFDLPWNTANDVVLNCVDWWGSYNANQQDAIWEWDRDKNMSTKAGLHVTGEFVSDLDLLKTDTGAYFLTGSAGATSTPSGNYGYGMEFVAGGSSISSQLMFSSGSFATAPELHLRSQYSGTYSAWSEVFHEGNADILEAVVAHDNLVGVDASEHIDWTAATANDFETTGELRSGAAFVTGNISVTGTVDGRDVAADGTQIGTNTSAIALNTAKTGYTAELARDDVGAALVGGTGITVTVDDGADTITIDASGSGVTNLSLGSVTSTTMAVDSSTGTNATLVAAIATTAAGLLTGADKAKLDGVATGATVNSADATLLARANHTGSQTASTISDFDTEVGNHSAVTANTAKVTNATHTGDVTGSGALTIAAAAVTLAKMADIATDTFIGRDLANTGVPAAISMTTARSMLNIEDGSTADQTKADIEALSISHTQLDDIGTNTHAAIDQHIIDAVAALGILGTAIDLNTAKVTNATHTGDVTGSGALTIATSAVSLAKMADLTASTFIGRNTGTGAPEALSTTTARTILNVEDGADVTDATNVDAAGAVMNSDTTTASMSFVVDEDTMSSNSSTKVPTQQSAKAYVDGKFTADATFTEDIIGSKLIAFDGEYDNGTVGTATTIDWNNGNHQVVTVSASVTLSFTAPTHGAATLSLRIVQNATGGYVTTLPTVKWPRGSSPTLSTDADAEDILSLSYRSSTYYGSAGIAFN